MGRIFWEKEGERGKRSGEKGEVANMPEWRKLYRDISDSKKLSRLTSDSPALLWTWMLPYTDCEGRILADANYIKGKVVSRLQDWDIIKVRKCLTDLDFVGLIQLYEVEGEIFAQFEQPQFDEHQKISKKEDGTPKKEAPCKIPAPPPRDSGPTTELLQTNSEVTPSRLDKSRLDKSRGESPAPDQLQTNSVVTPELNKPLLPHAFIEVKKYVIKSWNEFAKVHSLKPVIAIAKGSAREKHFKARHEEPAFDFDQILSKAGEQEFCFGANDRGWKISFDWIIKNPGNYIYIIEEKYLDDIKKKREWTQEENENDPY